ncbi:MAG: TRAP transporter small permease [Deltaproteobacteria bacterium]|nr:TRAP transporter small permease [Deltaproteobacteria bacterium]
MSISCQTPSRKRFEMAQLIKVVHSFSRWICWISMFTLIGMMLLTCSDVVLRYFGYPIKGTFDITGLLGAVAVALPIAYTQLLGRHVSMEFKWSRFPKWVQMIINSITCLLSIGMYALIAWQCILLGTQLRRVGTVSATVEIPLFPFVYTVAFGCALNSLILLINFYNLFAKSRGKLNPGDL